MGKHSAGTLPNEESRFRLPTRFFARNVGRSIVSVEDADFWEGGEDTFADYDPDRWLGELKEGLPEEKAIVDHLKGNFELGLRRLVDAGEYNPKLLDGLVAMRRIPVFSGIDHPTLGSKEGGRRRILGFTQSGATIAIPHPKDKSRQKFITHGRFINVETLENTGVVMHELAHPLTNIDTLVNEPFVNELAHDIMVATGMDTSELDMLYESNGRLLHKIRAVSGLTKRESWDLISSHNGAENTRALRGAIWAGAGMDVLGLTDKAYKQDLQDGMNSSRAAEHVLARLEATPAFAGK